MQKLKKMLFILLVLLSVNIYADNKEPKPYRIGYTTQYSKGQYNSDYYINNFDQSDTYNEPRKSPQRPFSGGTLEDWVDWARMNGVWPVGDEDWPSYVDKDYWPEFLEKYGDDYEDYVREWFDQHPDAPNNPFTPVGDMPWILGGMMLLAYIIRYKCKE